MPWYAYLLQFFSGAFLANGVPHFVKGVTGEPFPSPFGKPPGVGDSPPQVNVLWGFGNLLVGAVLFSSFTPAEVFGWIAFGAGVLAQAQFVAQRLGRARAQRK